MKFFIFLVFMFGFAILAGVLLGTAFPAINSVFLRVGGFGFTWLMVAVVGVGMFAWGKIK